MFSDSYFLLPSLNIYAFLPRCLSRSLTPQAFLLPRIPHSTLPPLHLIHNSAAVVVYLAPWLRSSYHMHSFLKFKILWQSFPLLFILYKHLPHNPNAFCSCSLYFQFLLLHSLLCSSFLPEYSWDNFKQHRDGWSRSVLTFHLEDSMCLSYIYLKLRVSVCRDNSQHPSVLSAKHVAQTPEIKGWKQYALVSLGTGRPTSKVCISPYANLAVIHAPG